MTSLRTFQTELDEISHREVAKQRAHAAAERAKLEKDVAAKKGPSSKAAHAHARKESIEAADAGKAAPAKEPPIPGTPATTGGGDASAASDIDEQLQVRPRRLPWFPSCLLHPLRGIRSVRA